MLVPRRWSGKDEGVEDGNGWSVSVRVVEGG